MPWLLDHIGGKKRIHWAFSEFVNLPENFSAYDFIPDEAVAPIRIIEERKYKSIPDFFTGPTTRFIIVSSKFKSLVEKYEPGIHWFIPIELIRKNGEICVDSFYFFKMGSFVKESIVLEESHIEPRYYDGVLLGYFPTSLTPRIMWKANQVENRHVWSDEKLKGVVAVSNSFFDELKNLDVSGLCSLESRLDIDF